MSIFDAAMAKRFEEALLIHSRKRRNAKTVRRKSLIVGTRSTGGVVTDVERYKVYDSEKDEYSVKTDISYQYPIRMTEGVSASDIIVGDFKSPNPHSYEVVRHVNLAGWTYQESKPDGLPNRSLNGTAIGQVAGPNMQFPTATRGSLDTRLLTELMDRVRGADVSVDLMQWRQTQKLFIGSQLHLHKHLSILETSTRKFVKFAKKQLKVRSKFNSASKAVGALWLTWVYGIKPTLQTIHDTLMTIASRSADPDGFVVFKVKAVAPFERTFVVYPGFGRCVYSQSGVSSAAMRVVLDMDPSAVLALSRYSSLSPASLAWELLPFSFVIDWFVDVGGYLNALETAMTLGSRFHSGHISYLVHGRESRVSFYKEELFTESFSGQGNARSELLSFERKILTALPLPELPRPFVKLSGGRLLNAAALLTNLLKTHH